MKYGIQEVVAETRIENVKTLVLAAGQGKEYAAPFYLHLKNLSSRRLFVTKLPRDRNVDSRPGKHLHIL